MGLFFNEASVPRKAAKTMVAQALQQDKLPVEAAMAQADETVQGAAKGAGVNTEAFIGAATVFIVLLIAAFIAAQIADSQTATESYMQNLAGLMQTLLTAWSAAVVGLIGGEAVGKVKS